MSSRSQSGCRKRVGSKHRHGDSGGKYDGRRRMFTKLIKDESAVIKNAFQARIFVEGMDSFDSKVQLLEILGELI